MHADFAYQLYTFNKASRQKCRDPRDRVFALLGHYSARVGCDQSLLMHADYSLPTAVVYRELAIRALTDAKSTFILNAVQHIGKRHQTPLPDSDRVTNTKANIASGGAAGNRPLVAQIRESKNMQLQIQGLVFDVVDRTSRAFERGDFRSHNSETRHILVQIWQDTCGHDAFDVATDHRTTRPCPLIALLDTCRAGWEPPFYPTEPREGFINTPTMPGWMAREGISYLRRLTPPRPMSCATSALALRNGKSSAWQHNARVITLNRKFAVLAGGDYALCPGPVEKGDLVVVLMGYTTPFVLRPTGGGDEFLLVGECYVHGIMQGQALSMLERGEKTLRDFRIL
ncbi:hypothetical protein PG991_016106 [Apiospora marii]|uniref:Heterokaryon incompatibility domain-containing protein n=1 Tax=Apiospora marii TaxID=335849 RepID=A0ABR1R0K4_9PEZI